MRCSKKNELRCHVSSYRMFDHGPFADRWTARAKCRRGSALTFSESMTRAGMRVLLLLAATFVGASCTSPVQQRIPAVAVAIRPVGDRPPSTDEIRQVHEALQPALLRAGASIAARRDVADF